MSYILYITYFLFSISAIFSLQCHPEFALSQVRSFFSVRSSTFFKSLHWGRVIFIILSNFRPVGRSEQFFAWIDAGYGHGSKSAIPTGVWSPKLNTGHITLVKLPTQVERVERFTLDNVGFHLFAELLSNLIKSY
jgi:hypothetical protein